MNKTVQVILVQVCLPVTVDKPDIRQQRSLEEFLLGDNMERPTLFTGQSLGHGQLALNDRAIESLGGFCFHQPFAAVRHFHQEVRHDVAGAGQLGIPGTTFGDPVEKIDLKSLLVSVPRVPHRARLLTDPGHLGTRGEDGCRGPFELSLAANGTVLFRTRHQQEGPRRAAAQAEGGDVDLPVRFRHNNPFAHEMKKQISAARPAP